MNERSEKNLKGVHPDLVKVVRLAAQNASFVVTEGLRTPEHQAVLVKAGASQTQKSRHLTGHAVDLAALVEGEIRWDWPLYGKLAEAMKDAAKTLSVPLEWGGVWDKTLAEYDNPMSECTAYVVRQRARLKKQGSKKEPFIDGPHFQLPWKNYP